jgi:predicted dehydrogenase
VKAIKGIVDSGRIGDLYMVRTDHNQNPEFAKDAWYRKRESAGGGAVIGSGIHMLDLLHWFCGDATLVSASTITLPERLDAETAASVTVEFEPATHQKTGCIGTLDISWAAPHHPWYQFLVVYGTKGTVSTLRGDVINICDDAGVEVLKAPEGDVWTDSFCDELRYWGECIVGSSRPMTHAGDALKSLEICLAAYRAAETHTSVRLPLAH